MVGSLILLGLIVILVLYNYFNSFSAVSINWDTVTDANFKPSVSLNDNTILKWRGAQYEGFNSEKNDFNLRKNGELALTLSKEIRHFKLVDCDQALCIFGIQVGSNHDLIGTNPTPDIDLVVVLWPQKKEIKLSNPCKGRQIDNFTVEQIESIRITVQCPDWAVKTYNISKYYRSNLNILTLIQ